MKELKKVQFNVKNYKNMTNWSSFSAEIIPTLSAQPLMLLKPRKENFTDNMTS